MEAKSMADNNPGVMTEPCVPQETYLDNVKLAHAYVPFQKLCDTFTPLESLKKGTAFPPLVNLYGWEAKRRFEVYEDE
jgi:hypothetical protein